MPTINIHGAGGGGEGGGPGPGGLNKLWEQLLANPNMATQREFLMRLNMLLPNNLFHSGGSMSIIQAMSRLVGSVGGAAGAAAGAGPQGAIASARASAQVATAAARVAAAAAMAASGGTGGRAPGIPGGAAVAGPRGPGWGAVLPGPIGRAARFGARMGLLGDLLGMGALGSLFGGVGLLAAGAYEAVRLPTQIGRVEGSFASEAKPYANLVKRLYAVGRAGGMSGAGLTKEFFPGEEFSKSYHTPAWMMQLGLTPDDAAEILGRYGIMPRSRGGARRYVEELRLGALSPGFAGMAPGTVEGLARQAGSMGLGVQRHPEFFLAMIARVMEFAVAKGMDRAQVLRSIQASIGRYGGSSAGFGTQSLLDFYQRMASSNLPGSRTGALQAQALGGASAAAGTIGSSPVVTMAVQRAIAAHGYLKTNNEIEGFFGPELYGQLSGTAPGRAMLKAIRTLGQHGNPVQLSYVRSILKSNPQLLAGIVRQGMGRFSGNAALNNALTWAAMGQVTGEGIPGYLADISGKPPGTVMGTRTLGFLQQMKGFGNFSPATDYGALLRGAGVPEQLIPGLVRAGMRHNIDPRILAAQMKAESGFRNVKSRNANGTTDYGYAQINSATLKRMGWSAEFAMNPEMAAEYEATYLAKHRRGGVASMIQAYNPRNPNEVPRFMRAMAQMFPTGLPEDIYGMEASVGQAQMAGSRASFEVFGNNLAKVNTELGKFAGWLHSFVHSGSTRAPTMPMSGGPN